MRRTVILLILSVVVGACSAPKPNSSTSTLPPHIIKGVPCYHSEPNGKTIFQMDPSIAKALGGYIEVDCTTGQPK